MTNSSSQTRQSVILVARPAAGGIRSHLISLLTNLDTSRFELTLAAPDSLLNTLPEALYYQPASLTIASKPSPLDLLAALNLAQLVAKTPGAIVHAHGVRAGIVASIARLMGGFPLVVTHHNMPPEGFIGQAVLEMTDFGCAATIAVSEAIADSLPSTDTIVIPNGINLADYGHILKSDARSELKINPDAFTAAFLGRLSREKAPDLILRTALLRPKIDFLIGGNGPEMSRLQGACPPNVRLLGRIANPTVLLSAADVVIIPSRSEGQGIVALEAMACGTPVIASRVGGLVQTLDQSGGGVLVDPERPTEIADALDKLIAEPLQRQSLAESGKTWVNQNCAIEQRVAEIESVYLALSLRSEAVSLA